MWEPAITSNVQREALNTGYAALTERFGSVRVFGFKQSTLSYMGVRLDEMIFVERSDGKRAWVGPDGEGGSCDAFLDNRIREASFSGLLIRYRTKEQVEEEARRDIAEAEEKQRGAERRELDRIGVYEWTDSNGSPYLPAMRWNGQRWFYWNGIRWVRFTGRKKGLPSWERVNDDLRLGRLHKVKSTD